MGVISSLVTRVNTRNLPTYRNESVIERVMDEEGVDRKVAERWFEEALLFLDLCAREKGLSPSPSVDDAWHGFILHTPDYARYCNHRFGRFIHHQPMREPNPEAYARAYELRRKIDRPLDPSIWPSPIGLGDKGATTWAGKWWGRGRLRRWRGVRGRLRRWLRGRVATRRRAR